MSSELFGASNASRKSHGDPKKISVSLHPCETCRHPRPSLTQNSELKTSLLCSWVGRLLVNRMANTEAGEAMIVAISGDPFAAALNGQSGQERVWYKVALNVGGFA